MDLSSPCLQCWRGCQRLAGIRTVPHPPRVRVAAVQCSSRMGSAAAVEDNAEKMERLARKAAEGGAKIIVFPEAALTGYTSQAFLHNWHIPQRRLQPRFTGIDPTGVVPRVDSPIVQKLVALAKELHVYMTIPFVEEVEASPKEGEAESQFFNTVCLAGPSGEVVVHYRKTHLWDYVDGSWASRGDSPGFVETEFGRVGIGICYDIHRLAQLYSNANLWALLYSVAWVGHPTDGPTERWFRKDLSETYLGRDGLKCFVIAANWSTDREYFWDGAGYSSMYGQDGQRLAYLDVEVGDSILYSDIPFDPS
ncbi:NIT2 [Symbiodinium sp. CCMP2592]|nr:NIT2 [Symbiodinium sp. CCMP2592]